MLRDNLPPFICAVQEVQQLLAAEQPEINAAETGIGAMLKEFSVESFTAATARYWEELLGFAPAPAWEIARRRERVYARLLSTSPMSPEMFKEIVENTCGTEVEIIEDADTPKVTVKFVGIYGVTPYLDDVKAEVEIIRPYHVTVAYEFIYATNAQLAAFTHTQLAAFTHQQIREGAML